MFTVGDDSHEAIVYIDKDNVDVETVKQIENISSHPSVRKARIMPDCHKGNGCCVGFTCELTQSILPSLIGGDIGCGMIAYPLPSKLLSKKKALEKIDRVVHSCIPMGNGWDKVHATPVVLREQYEAFYEEAKSLAIKFAQAYLEKCNIDISEFIPNYSYEWIQDILSPRIETDSKYDECALGTLGGGNHFIEINETDESTFYLSIHSGSRNLGHQIASYHYKKLISIQENYMSCKTETEVRGGGANIVVVEMEERDKNLSDDVDTRVVDPNMIGLTGDNAAIYFFDMIWAQTWAKMNRLTMLSLILNHFEIEFNSLNVIESVHNYIDFQDMIIRKGAISTNMNELCIIALNMRDGILICKGKGNDDWNCSGPHGCGRIQSRKSAKGHKSNLKGNLNTF